MVAFNEEHTLAAAVESLLAQHLPAGARWKSIWIVASGCTDRTVPAARALADAHPEVQVLVQQERRGKASALAEIFRAARGDYLVLLNADAAAKPGAIAALLDAADTDGTPFGVMGRPEPGTPPPGPLGRMLRLLWDLHHRFHLELTRSGAMAHLSDELLLLPIQHLPPMPGAIVNDGAFIGAWLSRHAGHPRYAPEAGVVIEVPWTLGDHLRQRRRILSGHQQVAGLVGVYPTTLSRYLIRNPRQGFRLLRGAVRGLPRGFSALGCLLVTEVAASAAAGWDRLPPRKNHRLWETISSPAWAGRGVTPGVGRTSASPGPSETGG